MSGISTGIGLMSGIDTGSLIEQLLAIEARPKILALNRQIQLQNEQAAFLGINSRLLSLKTAAGSFFKDKIFDTKTATSSDMTVLTASANTYAQPGTYQFLVDQLVSSSQLLSKGIADSDTTELGATEMSFEWGNGKLSIDTQLTTLNSGEGVRRGKIVITDSGSNVATVDLSRAVDIGDVLDAINSNTSVDVTASISGDKIVISGVSKIENSSGYNTATDLGIAKTATGDTITGDQINKIYSGMALTELNDGNGVFIASGLGLTSFTVNLSDGTSYDIVLGERDVGGETNESAVTNIQGVLDRINENDTNKLQATIGADGVSIKLEDKTGGAGTFEVVAGSVSNEQTARDLGIFQTGAAGIIAGNRVLAGLNSVLVKYLNGGDGLSGNTALNITDRNGGSDSFTIDENASISDIIDQINNSASVDVTASMNRAGNGLLITDNTGGTSNLLINGSAATELGIYTDGLGVAANTVEGSNLQLQYIAGSTKLDDMNYGKGIGTGSFRITDGYGNQFTVDIGSDAENLQDIIQEINSFASTYGAEIVARINDNGDGLLIEGQENAGGDPMVLAVKVESITGTTAKDLGILGEASGTALEDNYIDGSYEKVVALDATDTLDDIITKINNAGIEATATKINNGSSSNPFHLSITSKLTGTAGDLAVNSTGFDFQLDVLNEARDAVVFFGSEDPAKGILITSTTNTLDNVINGVTIDLKATSDEVVQLTIGLDTDKMMATANSFVKAYNDIITQIHKLNSYDADTETRGVLLGNSSISRIESQLQRTILAEADGVDTQFTRLVQVGIRFGEGGLLTLDEDKFRAAINDDLSAVKNLFAAKKVSESTDEDLGDGVTIPDSETTYDSLGVAEMISILANSLTDSIDGTLTLINQNYDTQIQMQEDRIAAFDVMLGIKRTRLQRQFAAMEQALASLQSQQTALSGISFISR